MTSEHFPYSTPALHSTVMDAIQNVAQSLEIEDAQQLVTKILYALHPDGMTVVNVATDGPFVAMAITELMYILEFYAMDTSFNDVYTDIITELDNNSGNIQTVASKFANTSSQLQAMECTSVRTKGTIYLAVERVLQRIWNIWK